MIIVGVVGARCACGSFLAQASETHDVLDHVWGWSQVGGAVVAVVALIVALASVRDAKAAAGAAERSASAAERTATAAEQTAATAAEELAMLKEHANRRAVIELRSVDVHALAGRSAVLQLGLFNSGNANLQNGWINLLVPPGTTIAPCANEKGQGAMSPVPLLPTPEGIEGASSSEYLAAPVTLVQNMASVAHYRLDFASSGRFGLRMNFGGTNAQPIAADAVITVS